MDAPEIQYITTEDGYRIAYRLEGAGPPIVLMPLVFNHILLPPITPLISMVREQHRFVRYDHRGQGMSTRGLSNDFNWQEFQLDLEALSDGLNLQPFVLMAPNWFAHVAIPYVVSHPGRVRALILATPTGLAEALPQGEALPMLPLARANWDLYIEAVFRTSVPDEDDEEVERWKRRARESTSQQDYLTTALTWSPDRVMPFLTKVDVPTLITYLPSKAWAFSFEVTARKMAAAIPGARLVPIADIQEDARVCRAFLEGLPPLSAPPASTALEARVRLTNRQLEVLRLIAAGKTNPLIAGELLISRNTVQNHVASILARAGLANRAEAAAYAQRHGLV